MYKKLNDMLNIVIGSCVGVFVGHLIYLYLDYKKRPGLYEMQSAPWYTSVIVYGLCTFTLLAAASGAKWIIRRKKASQGQDGSIV